MGRAKEAAGALKEDNKLRNEGKIDQVAGKVKAGAEKLVENVKQGAENVLGTKRPG